MKHALCLLIIVMLSGCAIQPATWSRETRYEEIAFQSLNVVDAMQTMRVARHPDKWVESESAWIIGEHPSQRTVVVAGLVKAALHTCITAELAQDGAPQFVQRIWEVLSISDVAYAVHGNYSVGLSVGF